MKLGMVLCLALGLSACGGEERAAPPPVIGTAVAVVPQGATKMSQAGHEAVIKQDLLQLRAIVARSNKDALALRQAIAEARRARDWGQLRTSLQKNRQLTAQFTRELFNFEFKSVAVTALQAQIVANNKSAMEMMALSQQARLNPQEQKNYGIYCSSLMRCSDRWPRRWWR